MSLIDEIVDKLIEEGVGSILLQTGFKYQKKRRFSKKCEQCTIILNTNLRKIRGKEAGYIEVCPAIIFEDIEKKVAELKGKKYSKGWPTAAANIGNLKPVADFLEWPVTATTDFLSLSRIINKEILDYAFPFWDSFNSIAKLIEGYENEDQRLTSVGNDYKWKLIAAYCLVGDKIKAKDVLENWHIGRPTETMLRQIRKIISSII